MSKQPIVLANRVAVITGGTRGIGRAIAAALGQAGAQVVISSSHAEAVERAATELRAQGVQCIGIPCDVSDLVQVQALLKQVLTTWSKVDIWVNNAGISGPFGYTLDVSPDVWERVLRVNLMGCYYGCITVLPHMLERRYGKIINLSGGGAQRAQRFLSAYSSSKAAIVRLSDALAREYKEQRFLSINVLEPGLVATDMLKQPEVVGAAGGALTSLPYVLRVMGTTAEEAAQLALRMASDETDGISGKIFSVMPRHRAIWRMARAKIRGV